MYLKEVMIIYVNVKKWTFYVRILYDYALLMYGKLYVMGFLKDRKSL